MEQGDLKERARAFIVSGATPSADTESEWLDVPSAASGPESDWLLAVTEAATQITARERDLSDFLRNKRLHYQSANYRWFFSGLVYPHLRGTSWAAPMLGQALTTYVPVNAPDLAGDYISRAILIELAKKDADELRAIAAEEGDPFNSKSLEQLLNLLEQMTVRKPTIFLLDSGDLKAIWRGPGNAQVGVQCLGGQYIHFTIFGDEAEGVERKRGVGLIPMMGLRSLVTAFGLESLVF
jgi:hypothetical protein